MGDLIDDVADGHWITNHDGPRCVACGWWDPRPGEDYGHAARRHVAAVAAKAALLAAIEHDARELFDPAFRVQAVPVDALLARSGTYNTGDGTSHLAEARP